METVKMATAKDPCDYCPPKAPKVATHMLTSTKDGWVAGVCCDAHLPEAQKDLDQQWGPLNVLPWKEWKTRISPNSRTKLQDFEEGGDFKTLRQWFRTYRRRWRDMTEKEREADCKSIRVRARFGEWFKVYAQAELTVNGEGEDWRLVPALRKKKQRTKK